MSFIDTVKTKLKERKTKKFFAQFDIICEKCGEEINVYKQSSLCPHEDLEEFLRNNQHEPNDEQ